VKSLASIALAVVVLSGVAVQGGYAQDKPKTLADPDPRQVVTHFFVGGEGKIAGLQTVVGNSQTRKIGPNETFLDIGREYDVGYNELIAANPHIDPWVPDLGTELIVPSEWVLPKGDFEGLVLNIPEMRLYYYVPSPREGGKSSMVITYPVGLGRQEWQTPQGGFRIRGKTRNPAWVIPESIKVERLRDKGLNDSVIPGGDPENPLGRYRIELTLPSYAIHGTNKMGGIGMQVSHGCVRMYPEDIAAFFPVVQIGSAGRFVYQPIKLGVRRGRVMVEVHEDIYGVAPWPWLLAQELIDEMGLERYVDTRKLEAAVEASSGIPTDVSYTGWTVLKLGPPVSFDQRGDPASPYPDQS
jgi:L,D-transpeptidase ErfK/SrfK